MAEKKEKSFIEKLKEKAAQQVNYGGTYEASDAKMGAESCPNCGAGRTRQDGITHCAYCGFEFIATTLTDGMFINKSDNSIQ